MNRWHPCLLVVCALGLTGEAAAQTPNYNPVNPFFRRALREKAVAYVGLEARAFVESPLGDEAAAALLALSRPAAAELVAFYQSGQLYQVPRPGDLLRLISQLRGDDVALWAIQHVRELSVPENCNAYLANPREFTLGLKTMQVPTTPAPGDNQRQLWIGGAVVLAVVGLVLWWRQRQKA